MQNPIQSLTLNEFYIVAGLFVAVMFISICITIFLGRSKIRREKLAARLVSVLNSKLGTKVTRVLLIIAAPVYLILVPVVFLLALPVLVICLIREVLRDLYEEDVPYNPDNDPEYIKMMEEVNESSLHSSLPSNLRQMYRDLYKASCQLTESNDDQSIYQVLSNNRLHELIDHKKACNSLSEMKNGIAGNIQMLAYFWKSSSFEDSITYIHRALDYADAHDLISFPKVESDNNQPIQ